MKKIALIAAFGVSLLSGFRSEARVNINVSFGMPVVQQSWYASDNDYIYMPDQGVYFNTRQQMYVFQDGGRWCAARQLPGRFGNVNIMKVRTMRLRERRPFERDMDNRRRFMVAQNGGFGRGDRDNAGRFDQRSFDGGASGRFDNRRFDNGRDGDNDRFGRGRR